MPPIGSELGQATADVLEIPFTTPGGTGPLTWGQRAFLRTIVPDEESHYNLWAILAVPSGRSVHDVADTISTFVQRHNVLVTLFPRIHTDPYQKVAEHGVIRLMVHASADDEAERVAAEVCDEANRRFRLEDEWPVRFALVLGDGAPRHLALVFSHMVVDGAGFRVVVEELEHLLDRQALPPTEGTWSSLELAAYEQSTKGRAQSAAAMRHWRTEMLECPSTIFDFAKLDPEPLRLWDFRMVSPAVADAASRIAKLHRCSTSAVILAAVAAVLGHYTGHSRIPMQLVASNRWRPQVVSTISQLSQLGMFSVTLDDMSFSDLAEVTWKRALACYQYAAYDPLDQSRETKTLQQLSGAYNPRVTYAGPRVTDMGRNVTFSDLRRTDGWALQPVVAESETALTDLRASTGIEVTGQWKSEKGVTFSFSVLNSKGYATITLGVDTAFIPERVARQMLTGMESLLVQAAGRVVRLDEVGAITDIAPVVRGEGWARVDGVGWIELVKVANLVAATPPVVRCAIFVEPVGRTPGSGRLVAYLVATHSDVTPELVHDQVHSSIDGRTDVMAPQHYILCAGPPTDDSHAAWRSQPVRSSGSGRC